MSHRRSERVHAGYHCLALAHYMPIDLNEHAKRRLEELLADCLHEIRVQNNSFLDYRSLDALAAIDNVLPGPQSSIRETLQAFVSEQPFSDFVSGEIATQLSKREFRTEVPDVSLIELPEYADAPSRSNELVAAFISLPWSYELFAALPHEIGAIFSEAMGAPEYLLSDRVALIHGSALSGMYPARQLSPVGLLLVPSSAGLRDDVLYLRIRVDGYIDTYGTTRPALEAQNLVRSFFGLCLALRVLEAGVYTYGGPQKRHLIAYRATGNGWTFHSARELPADSSQAIAGIGLNETVKGWPESVQHGFILRELKQMWAVFADARHGPPILLAAQWLFDGRAGGNQLLAFVQITVALEILLGEKESSDLVGLGELLANRCAYLIAGNREQRDKILRDFRRIYATRSKIVHRGKNRLTVEELADLSTLEWLCARVIQGEAKLLGPSPQGQG